MAEGGISIHAVDARSGLPATGMRVEVLRRIDARMMPVARGRIGDDALLHDPALAAAQQPGSYEARFHAGDYFDAGRAEGDLPPLVDIIVFAFEIGDPSRHVHLPLKMTPAGYSLFRGDP